MGVKLSFELDASKVFAKLHRGACQTRPQMFFFNSGILDDQDVKPDEVDEAKISFDLDGPGQYELGVVISEELAAKLAKSPEDIMDAAEKNAKDNKDKNDKDKDKKSTDKGGKDKDGKDKGDKDKDDKGDKDMQAEKDQIDKDTPITEDPTRKVNEGFLAFLKETKDRAKDGKRKNYTDVESVPDAAKSLLADPLGGMDPANPDDQDEIRKVSDRIKTQDIGREVQAALDKNRDNVKKFMEANLDNAVEYLRKYMLVFAGDEEADKITAKDVKVTYLPDDVSTPYDIKKYENYQIPALTDEQVRQKKVEMLKDMQKDPKGKEYVFRNMCFKIGYSVSLGK